MKFESIAKEITECLKSVSRDKSEGLQYEAHIRFTGNYERAILMALRMNGVNLTKFFTYALWKYEDILTDIVDDLPSYIRNKIAEEITEEKGN